MKRSTIAVVVAGVALSGLLGSRSDYSLAVTIEPCNGPRPIDAHPEYSRRVVVEGQRFTPVMGLNCIPVDDTVSATAIQWGDGSSEPASITYSVNSEGTTKQAWLGRPHAFARATCAHTSCLSPYHEMTATAIEDQTGERFDLRTYIVVTPAPDVIELGEPHPHAGRRFHGELARIKTGGTRFARELWASVRWGDGVLSRARAIGAGRDFRVLGTHRWAAPGDYTVRLRFHDTFARRNLDRIWAVRVGHSRR